MDAVKASEMKVLFISNMYPSQKYPSYGAFVKRIFVNASHQDIQAEITYLTKCDSKVLKIIRLF